MKRTTRNVAGRGRRWRAAVAITIGCAATSAHAESWFQFEAGIGVAKSADSGDNVWIQYAMPHKETLTTPAWMVGITGQPLSHLAYHVDFVDLGEVSSSSQAVYDFDYDANTHKVLHFPAPVSSLSGSGRTLGIALTLEPNYTWHDVRFGIEGGPFIFRGTWNVSITNPDGSMKQLDHAPQVQIGYVAGASIGYKDISLSYRYYSDKEKWNPNPGLIKHTSTLMVTYRHSFW